ncbi:MAG: SDR family oxidoreductase [Deltaproteobacteria bacterium]|nr:SDR family oxidoreductase [Deltaproteobacteria bacterium]
MVELRMDFAGKRALVTGASRGLGKAVALGLAAAGARVVLCGRKQEDLDKVLEEFRGTGFPALVRSADVGKSDQVASLFEAIDREFGGLDILVNNVGTNVFTPSVAEADEALWDKMMQTSLKSAFLVSTRAVRMMRGAGAGKIVNISSIAARRASPGMGLYCIAKAGLEMMTRVLAAELARHRINVNAVAPGMLKTRFSQPFWSNEDLLKDYLKGVPLGRIAETGDVVGAVLFLASSLSDYITGEVITVDGGAMA